MKKVILDILALIFSKFKLKKVIIFESHPDYSCNTYPVFLELKNKLSDYKFVWMVNKDTKKADGVDDIIYFNPENIFESLKRVYYLHVSKISISCNRFIRKMDNRQISLFLCHGSKTKKTKGIYEMGEYVDYINVQSHFFDDIIQYEYSCDESQLVYLGYPRCDYFYKQQDIRKITKLLDGKNEKYIIWLPTFRKQKGSNRIDCKENIYNNIGMPLIYSVEILEQFNEFLQIKKLHLLYKPHPAQDVSALKKADLSNIHIINDKDISDADLQLYEVIAQSEALITDYSSVFFDYLLLDKSIATTTDDIESWKEGRGFAFNIEEMYDKATTRVPNLEELKVFIEKTLNGTDDKATGRREVRDLTNMYQDGNSAQRVVDFILEKLGEKK